MGFEDKTGQDRRERRRGMKGEEGCVLFRVRSLPGGWVLFT